MNPLGRKEDLLYAFLTALLTGLVTITIQTVANLIQDAETRRRNKRDKKEEASNGGV